MIYFRQWSKRGNEVIGKIPHPHFSTREKEQMGISHRKIYYIIYNYISSQVSPFFTFLDVTTYLHFPEDWINPTH